MLANLSRFPGIFPILGSESRGPELAFKFPKFYYFRKPQHFIYNFRNSQQNSEIFGCLRLISATSGGLS